MGRNSHNAKMGSAESGHGAGNAREVAGDNTVGYVSKHSRMTKEKSGWNDVRTFDHAFNTHVYNTTQHRNIYGDHNQHNNNNLAIHNHGGVQTIQYGNGNAVGDAQARPSPAEAVTPPSKPRAELITVDVAEVADFQSMEEYTNLILTLEESGPIEFAERSGIDVVLFNADRKKVLVTKVKLLRGLTQLHLHCDIPVPPCQRLYGEIITSGSTSPFKGSLLPEPGASPVRIQPPMMNLAVGFAKNPWRTMVVDHTGKAIKPLDYCGWSHSFMFKAFKDKQPGTVQIAVSEAHGPHRTMVKYDSPLMSGHGWSHKLSFWAYPDESNKPGTIRVAVGYAKDPWRTHWVLKDAGALDTHGWSHSCVFRVFPQ